MKAIWNMYFWNHKQCLDILYILVKHSNKYNYHPNRAFGGPNKIVYSTRFETRRAIILLLPGLCDKEGNANNIIIAWVIICDLNSARRWSHYACVHSVRVVCKQTKWQPAVTHNRKIVRWHTKPYMNNNDNIGWLFFGEYKNTLPSMLTILPSSSTRAILLASRAIYSCIPLKAIQYYININIFQISTYLWIVANQTGSCSFSFMLYFRLQKCI